MFIQLTKFSNCRGTDKDGKSHKVDGSVVHIQVEHIKRLTTWSQRVWYYEKGESPRGGEEEEYTTVDLGGEDYEMVKQTPVEILTAIEFAKQVL